MQALASEARADAVEARLRSSIASAEDLDLGAPPAEIGQLEIAERPFLVDVESELVGVPGDRSLVIADAKGDVIVTQAVQRGHGFIRSVADRTSDGDGLSGHSSFP